eukprot:2428980-Pyramimonas_sp.AAC.2
MPKAPRCSLAHWALKGRRPRRTPRHAGHPGPQGPSPIPAHPSHGSWSLDVKGRRPMDKGSVERG